MIIDKLWQRGQDFLGTKYAIMGGAMSWVSERKLVSAISNAGGFGVIACGSMPPELLDAEIKATKQMTSQPFGVNLIIMHPKLAELIAVCQNNQVSHVVLAGGIPKSATITLLQDAGIKVICFAPALSIAKKLLRLKADALIIEGNEAGGHIGPVSTFVLVQEILPHITEIPIFVAGGIARGEAIATLLQMGAAGCQLGTRLVCATESIAHADFKQSFIRASARDASASVQFSQDFPVIPVRALENKATKDFINVQKEAIDLYHNGNLSKEEAQLKIEHYWAGALKRAVIDGDVATGSVMAGQSVGMVEKQQSSKEILDEIVIQAEDFLTNICQKMMS